MKTRSKQKKSENHIPQDAEPSDFRFKITKIAVSQICKSVGFKSAQLSALDTLTHVATLYIKTIGKYAASYSNSANRTRSNLIDVINALHDLSLVRGFVGAPTLHSTDNSVLSSEVLKDISVFVKISDEIPFAKPIPRENSVPPSPILDSWLPRLPEESTYKKSEKIEKERKTKRDFELWENSGLVRSCSGTDDKIERVVDKNKKKKKNDDRRDLATEREKVRFKIGRI